MKLFCVRKAVFFLGNPEIDSFHYTMFHGSAKRGEAFQDDRAYSYDDNYEFPLRLWINVFRENAIIQPHGNLLLSAKFRARISGVQRVDVLDCTTAGICSIPYAEGDFSYSNRLPLEAEDPPLRLLHDSCQSPAKAEIDCTRFCELICPRIDQVVSNASSCAKIQFPDLQEEIEIPVWERIQEYPLLWHAGVFVLSEDLFRRLGDLFNPTYFRVQTINVSL